MAQLRLVQHAEIVHGRGRSACGRLFIPLHRARRIRIDAEPFLVEPAEIHLRIRIARIRRLFVPAPRLGQVALAAQPVLPEESEHILRTRDAAHGGALREPPRLARVGREAPPFEYQLRDREFGFRIAPRHVLEQRRARRRFSRHDPARKRTRFIGGERQAGRCSHQESHCDDAAPHARLCVHGYAGASG